jgi:hypothetical protein
VNYSNATLLQQFHGKVITLNVSNHYMPFPALFIIHEMHVCGVQVFQPVFPVIHITKTGCYWTALMITMTMTTTASLCSYSCLR